MSETRCRPSSSHSLKTTRESKSRSCENLVQQHQQPPGRRHLSKQCSEDYYSLRSGNHRVSSQPHFECPVEVQTQSPLSWEEVRKVVEEMEEEFLSRRKLIISGLPPDISHNLEALTKFLDKIKCQPVSKTKDGCIRVVFPSASQTKESLSIINTTVLDSHKLSACYGHPDSLLFVGNLPYTYTSEDLKRLFRKCGEILRCFVVHSPESGLSKGYGFVEFAHREEALLAKQQNATKVIGLRSLRVDFSDNGMQTCEDLHSQTLFVDRLPKGFIEDGSLKKHFSEFGRVNFCQVALSTQTGASRGFAFIDMSTSREAEHAQKVCNGGTFSGHEIRVSFGMPCRHGACILQHRPPLNTAKMCLVAPSYGCQHRENMFYPPPFPPGDWQGRGYPLCSLSLNHSINNCLTRSVSLTHFPPSEPHSPITRSLGGVAKSSSAPDILTPSPSPVDLDNPPLVRKRSLCELDRLGAYDKAFIGQHQQGIPFLHPLKRIRTDQMYE